MNKVLDDWRDALELTSKNAVRYRWIRQNPHVMREAAKRNLSLVALDAYIDQLIGEFNTGVDLV